MISDRMVLRTTLARMVQEGDLIVRLGRGIYCYPMLDRFGKVVLPGPDAVARALARRYCVRILPCGAQAARRAGLTTLDVFQYDYLTDGSEQVFHLGTGTTVRFLRRKSTRVYSFLNESMRDLSEGFRYIGQGRVGECERQVAARILAAVGEEEFRHDVKLCPGWVREEFHAIRGLF